MALRPRYWVTDEELRTHFTHVGWLGICPVYIGAMDDPDCAKLATRNGIPEWVMDLSEALLGLAMLVRSTLNPAIEPLYPIRVTGELVFED